MQTGDNRRKNERVDAGFVIQIKCDTFNQFLEEHAVNISQGGIFIRTSQAYTIGTLLHFQFTSMDQGELIDGLGRVVHVTEEPSGHHGIGLEFLNLSDQSEEMIEKIVSSRYES